MIQSEHVPTGSVRREEAGVVQPPIHGHGQIVLRDQRDIVCILCQGADEKTRVKESTRNVLFYAYAVPGIDAAAFADIAANAKDFEARFDLAALLAHDGDFRAAFDQLLEVVLRDKGEQRERARKQLVEWFNACPDADAVGYGRRYLGMYLN